MISSATYNGFREFSLGARDGGSIAQGFTNVVGLFAEDLDVVGADDAEIHDQAEDWIEADHLDSSGCGCSHLLRLINEVVISG